MKLFSVHEPPDGDAERAVFVPEGFSWNALLFSFLWALWHRMWVAASLLFAVSAALTVATNLELLGSDLAALWNFGVALIFGFEARSLQVKALERVGFRRTGLIQASNSEAAELLYFEGRLPIAAKASRSRLRAPHDDTLGIFGNV